VGVVDRPVEEELFGRDDALGRLAAAVAAAGAGTGSSLLISGSAGMGKTALLRAAAGRTQGVQLVWGTCVEAGGAPGYWPWTQALNELVRRIGVAAARAAAGSDAELIATLVPALGERRAAEESDRARMLLLDATVAWLRAVATTCPLVVVLDDLQWADESSLSLLELVVQSPRPSALCVLGAFRQDEVPRRLQARLTALVTRADHVHLTGLDAEATRRYVQQLTTHETSPETVDTIYRRTGGHPFFTRELARAATDVIDEQAPTAVREAVDRRVRRLSATAQRVLQVSAVTGSAVLPDVVAAVTGLSSGDIGAALREGAGAGMVVAEDGRLRFAHDLFRETLAEGVEPEALPGLHLAVGRALEERLARGGEVSASELARHFRAAVGCGGVDAAVVWAIRAAQADRSALALAEAATCLRRLRTAVADAGVALADADLVDVLLAEADVLARRGRSSDARGLVRAARSAAERLRDPARISRTALAAAALGSQFAARRDEVVAELESALRNVGGFPELEARLTAALARELQHSVPEQRARAGPLTERALELGRHSGDLDVLAACLLARHDVLWTPGEAAARADVAAELVSLAQQAGDREREAEALLLHANALLESGSAAFEAVLDRCLELLVELDQPRHLYTLQTRRACLALMRGQTEAAAVLIEQAATLGERLREPDSENVRMSQRLELVRERGLPDELTIFAGQAVSHWTGAPVHAHAVAAGFSARAGDLDGARHHLAAVHDLGGSRADRSYLWSVFVRELAVAAAALDDRELCQQLLDELRPLLGSCGVNGAVVAFAGCHSHTAGLLAGVLGDRAEAQSLLEEACGVYERLGVSTLDAARRDLATWSAPTPKEHASLLRRGQVWHVTYAGSTAAVPHCKGLQDIARLVQRPGNDVHVLDLVQSPMRSDAAGDLLDHRAVDSYRKRLADLSTERLEAEKAADSARLLVIEGEYDALVAELQSGTAAAGRRRSFANHPSERARKAVTARIRDAVRRLDADLPELAAHLDRMLITGVQCRYRGDALWLVDV
jgi:hypothetical protein